MRSVSKARIRQAAERRGRYGELVAALYLMGKGYRIVRRRFKCRVGEIDLVARKGRTVIFAEVKRRSRPQELEQSLLSVNTRRIVRAASVFLSSGKYAGWDIRFDVIFIASGRWPIHLKHAFEARE